MDIVSLIRSYVEGLLEAENRFIEHLDSYKCQLESEPFAHLILSH